MATLLPNWLAFRNGCYTNFNLSISDCADREWIKAGNDLVRCAEDFGKLHDLETSAALLCEAGEYYERQDGDMAVSTYKRAVVLLTELGMFPTAALMERRMGDVCHSLHDKDGALEHYRAAYEYYSGQGDATSAMRSMISCIDEIDVDLDRTEIVCGLMAILIDSNLRRNNATKYLCSPWILRLLIGKLYLCQTVIVSSSSSSSATLSKSSSSSSLSSLDDVINLLNDHINKDGVFARSLERMFIERILTSVSRGMKDVMIQEIFCYWDATDSVDRDDCNNGLGVSSLMRLKAIYEKMA